MFSIHETGNEREKITKDSGDGSLLDSLVE